MSTLVAIGALFVALGAWIQARRSARQLAQLTEMYWQLKYEHGELKAALRPAAEPPPAAPAPAFVPLASIKRSSS